MRQIFLLLSFLIFTPTVLGISLFSLTVISRPKISQPSSAPNFHLSVAGANTQLFAALPKKTGEVLGVITTQDARPIIIERYLKKYHSPLASYSQVIYEAANSYQIDYRLIIAIAQCESNLCRYYKSGTYNCWGFENGETQFLSWNQAIYQVAKTLKEDYINIGLTTPELIMPKYAPPSVEKGGPWAKCVRKFMEELEYGNVD